MENISYIPEWVKNSTIYHIYPFGFFGAPKFGDMESETTPRLELIRKFYPHFDELGINVVQFGPIFESVSHGYDTTDFMKIDHRLGSNDLFKEIVEELHQRNIRVIVDGVFNHVGRNFNSFKDVQKYKEKSWRLHWHFIDFNSNNPFNDGFDYKNWEGHYSLVKLNLLEPDVREYIFSVSEYWLREIGIDGWRLDVAYQIPRTFWREFRKKCKTIKPDCFLIGEMIHGPYGKWVGPDLLDAGTGYQVNKSIWSGFNSNNLYELKAVLEQNFNPNFGLNKGILLVNFLGNHDLTRIRSQLSNENSLFPAFLFLFTTNGLPKIYYGDEIGLKGEKTETSDDSVRQMMILKKDDWPDRGQEIFDHVKLCIRLRKAHHSLQYGNLTSLYADDSTIAFLRKSSKETMLIVLSASENTKSCSIPLWNLNLDGRFFQEQLTQGGKKEYRVVKNKLFIDELYPSWGRVLKLVEN